MTKIENYQMQRDGTCRPCGVKLLRGTLVIRTPAIGGQDNKVYICLDCARTIAKIVLMDSDLDQFGQELVMYKLEK